MTRGDPGPITEILDHVLGSDPDRVALVAPSGTLTYRELDSAANAAAAALRELGVRPGHRVAASLPNDIDIVVTFHGAMRLGAIWVGVNRALARPEKEELLQAAAPTLLIADADTAAMHQDSWRVIVAGGPGASSEWADAVTAMRGTERPPTPDQHRPGGIAFTSGTTGLPKGIVHSQHNLVVPGASLVASRGYDPTLRKGDCLPLTILNLQVLSTLVTSQAGGCCILTDRRDARGVAEWIARESVNVWNGVPAMLYSMVHDPELDPSLLGSLRDVWTGGAACPEDLFGEVRSRFGLELRQSYGLTEAPTIVSIEAPEGHHVPGSSGTVLPHLEVAIVDDTGAEVPGGHNGEIVVRAASQGEWAGVYRTMLGYWTGSGVDPFDSTDLRTGDIGSLDALMNIHVHDRKKLVIMRGGANVYPAEVERIIDRLPGVRASAIIGLPDPRLGQVVAAVVEIDPGSPLSPDEVIEHCRALLARYKIPERVVLVEALPRNAMGKIQRGPLSDLFPAEEGTRP